MVSFETKLQLVRLVRIHQSRIHTIVCYINDILGSHAKASLSDVVEFSDKVLDFRRDMLLLLKSRRGCDFFKESTSANEDVITYLENRYKDHDGKVFQDKAEIYEGLKVVDGSLVFGNRDHLEKQMRQGVVDSETKHDKDKMGLWID